ncbi:S-layer homology domain-containing protein [Papillibacter cinnamivorans]|uniref:Spore germination protein YaaH n=1 Tax=Papillibacter cinnamivorans DSM 12816 TaxID=1122930 RepID=A0A1W2CPD6_9FIRM|nr:S-layer homology domain-containing protein [Papillibacter cinnamivorans]SMC86844.1 Spore germination protein YaaH [Papillibacter cinnamivorans DSM 12816]
MKKIRRGPFLIFIFLLIVSVSGLPAYALDYKYSMSYIYFGDSSQYSQLVSEAQDSLNEVSPAYFTLDDGGSLVLTSAADSGFVQTMHDAGILVVPFLSNGWDRNKGIAALSNREALSSQLAAAVSEYGLDGVNIDIENVTPNERTAYVDFVRMLRSKLPEDARIVVSVAANPWGTSLGWTGSYDYAQLAEYSDYLMIMAYDESYCGSDPGPVASISFVEKSIQYALSVVSKDKIVLGLPFYGRIWSADGGYPDGYGVSDSAIEALIGAYDGTVSLDEASLSSCATITVKASDVKPTVGGSKLPAGTYVIWYSGEAALKAELELVTKYDIKGTGSWSLGQETDDTWNYYTLWLNGCTFRDVPDSWAKYYILSAYLKGWMIGVSSESFSPSTSLTRAQAAAVLVRMLGLTAAKDSDYSFSDCAGNWAEAHIDTARKYGILSGVGGNLFEPDRQVTREEIAVMLSNLLGYDNGGGTSPFTDVTADGNSWSYGAICALSASGVLTGYPDRSFRPDAPVTRAEMAAMAVRISIS